MRNWKRTLKLHRTLIRRAQIRTWYLPNTNLKRSRYTILIDVTFLSINQNMRQMFQTVFCEQRNVAELKNSHKASKCHVQILHKLPTKYYVPGVSIINNFKFRNYLQQAMQAELRTITGWETHSSIPPIHSIATDSFHSISLYKCSRHSFSTLQYFASDNHPQTGIRKQLKSHHLPHTRAFSRVNEKVFKSHNRRTFICIWILSTVQSRWNLIAASREVPETRARITVYQTNFVNQKNQYHKKWQPSKLGNTLTSIPKVNILNLAGHGSRAI
jgi:hypothetical protein